MLALLGLAALVAAPAVARGEGPCRWSAAAGVPIRLAAPGSEVGSALSACAATEAGVATRGALAIDLDRFYGRVALGASLRGRVALSDRVWLSLDGPGLAFRLLVNATIEATALDATPVALGWHAGFDLGPSLRLAPHARLVLPTGSGHGQAVATGYELGLTALLRPAARWELLGAVVASSEVLWLGDTQDGGVQLAPSLDLTVAALPWLTLGAGVGGRLGAHRDGALEALEPRALVRLTPGAWVLELAAALPVAGREPTLAHAALSLSRSLGAGPIRRAPSR